MNYSDNKEKVKVSEKETPPFSIPNHWEGFT